MLRTRILLSTAAAVSAAALLAACSSDSGSSSSSDTGSASSSPSSSGSTSSSTSSSPESNRVSASTLESVVLRTGDLPSSWKATAHDASGDADDSDDTMAQQLAKCIGTSVTPPKVDTAEKSAVHSQDFSDGTNQITSEAKPALDVAAQKTFDKEVIASPKSGDCFAKVLSASAVGAAPGAKVENIKTTVAGPKSGQPDSVQVNFDVRFDVVGQGKSQTFAFSTASILTDTIEAEVDVVGIGGAVPDSVKSAAIDAVAKRVAAA